MSRTYRKPYTSDLRHNGEHGPHNTLTREFKGIDGCWLVKNCRGLIDRRDYESSRNKAAKHIMTQKRRTVMKRNTNRFIEEALNDE